MRIFAQIVFPAEISPEAYESNMMKSWGGERHKSVRALNCLKVCSCNYIYCSAIDQNVCSESLLLGPTTEYSRKCLGSFSECKISSIHRLSFNGQTRLLP